MWTVLLRFLSALVSNWVEPRKPQQDIGWGEKRYFFTLSVSLRVPGNSCAVYDELLPNASPPLGSGNAISCPCLSNPTGGDGFPPSLVPRCINNHRWSPQLCPRLCKSFLQDSLFFETTQVNSASWRDLAGYHPFILCAVVFNTFSISLSYVVFGEISLDLVSSLLILSSAICLFSFQQYVFKDDIF